MLHKTQGIVLRTTKHQDANLIVRIFTVDRGVMDFMIKGYGSATSRRKFSFFQPMSGVEIVYMEKPSAELHKIQESHSMIVYHSLQTDPIKLTLGLSVMEIISYCLDRSEGDNEIYDFLTSFLQELEEAHEKMIHLFLFFLVKFTEQMGVAPSNRVANWEHPVFFDMQNGEIRNQEGGNTKVCALILLFLRADFQTCRTITFTQEDKKLLISTLFQYYHFHIPRFHPPKTLSVFGEVFEES